MLAPPRGGGKASPISTIGVCVAAVAAGFLPSLACHRPSVGATVVLLSLDTVRADRLGLYGYATAETPAIDATGREGLVFDSAWTTAPLTLPAHASMLTGRWPPRHGVRANGVHRLGDDVPVVTEVFARDGFHTAAFIGAYPLVRRFGLARGYAHYDDVMPARAQGSHYPERRGGEVMARAVDWLSRRAPADRVFLWVHLFDPHAEYAPPPPFSDRFAARPYDGEVAYVDSLVAALRRALEEAGRWERAILVIVGDHGEGLGEHGEETHGLLLHEATLRVPLIVRGPGIAGRRVAEPVSVVDVGPTLLARAGLPPLAGADGRDLAQAPDARREVYAETIAPLLDLGWSGLRAVRRGWWKLVEGPTLELFDLSVDSAEARNLWPGSEGPTLRQALAAASSGSVTAHLADIDADAREALASLGYATGKVAVPEDFGRGLPDPRRHIGALREIDAAASLPPAASAERLQALAQRFQRSSLVRRRLAAARMNAGDPDGAIEAYRDAARLGYGGDDLTDALAEAYLRAGEARVERGEIEGGLQRLDEAVRLAPSRADVAHALGVAHARAGRLEHAITWFRRAAVLDPTHASSWFSLGLALERLGRAAEARAAYEHFLTLAGPSTPERRHASSFVTGAARPHH